MTDESKPNDQNDAQAEGKEADIVDQASKTTGTPETMGSLQAQAAPQRSNFFPMIAGGVITAGLGFFAGQYNGPLFAPTEDGQDPIAVLEGQIAELQTQISEQTDALNTEVTGLKTSSDETTGVLSALQQQVETLAGVTNGTTLPEAIDPAPLIAEAIAPFEPLPDRLDAVGADLRGALAALGERVEELEKQPAANGEASGPALAAFQRDVEALRTELQAATGDLTARIEASEAATIQAIEEANALAASAEGQVAAALAAAEARVTAAEEEAAAEAAAAEAAARKAAALAALGEIEASLQTGEPFEGALGRLTEAVDEEVPAVLSAHAADGVPTLAELNESFGPAANAALTAVRSAQDGGGIGMALANRFNVRSSTPREGDDPDAVLSRIDAAASAGDFETAFNEAEMLPDEAKEALAGWMMAVQSRTQVQDAVATLRTDLSTD